LHNGSKLILTDIRKQLSMESQISYSVLLRPRNVYFPIFFSLLLCYVTIDMDMSYTRVLHIKVAHGASHK
jgi:hypothetical protein